jgi:hypothetical protein
VPVKGNMEFCLGASGRETWTVGVCASERGTWTVGVCASERGTWAVAWVRMREEHGL